MAHTATPAQMHYTVTMTGQPAGSRVSVWGAEAFAALRAERRIDHVWSITPLTYPVCAGCGVRMDRHR